MPKQFRFQQVLGQRAAVDGHKGMMLPVAVEVESARHQLFSRPAFAHDQHGAVGIGHFVNQIVNVLHLSAGADDVLKAIPVLEFLAEINIFPQSRLVIERPLHRHLQLIDLERLGHVIVGTHLHGLDRRLHRRVGRDQNDRCLAMMFAHVPEHIEPRHRFHLDVGDNYLRLNAVQLFDRFGGAVKGENLVPFFATESHDDLHHCRFVINN